MTIKLDMAKPHGTIWGHAHARYEQEGILFTYAGDPIDAPPIGLAESAAVKAIPKRNAVQFLRGLLADGALPVLQIRAAAGQAGFGWRTIQRAKAALGAIAIKDGQGAWSWKAATKDAKTPCK